MPKKTGRPKKSSQELIQSGARRGRIDARIREEQEADAPKIAQRRVNRVREFCEFADKVNETFANRIDRIVYGFRAPNATETSEQIAILSRTLDSKRFSWPPAHALTLCRNYATAVATGAIHANADDLAMCGQFLYELSHGAPGFIFDVCESDLLDKAIVAFGKEGDCPGALCTISVLIYVCWKDAAGNYRFSDGANSFAFDPRDIEILDAASDALQKHWRNTGREWKAA
jgi:hypothetical protein